MKQLYQVRTKGFKTYYVMATGYDEAKHKAEQAIVESDGGSILNQHGDLKIDYEFDKVTDITCLTDKLIT